MTRGKTLALPGNPRYQPKSLLSVWGYDNLASTCVEVEIAALRILGRYGYIPPETMALLTDDVALSLRAITTTQMDVRERKTKHDIRALVQLMQQRMPVELRRFVHVPLTSYDVIDTARALQFVRAHHKVVKPLMDHLIRAFRAQAMQYARLAQIGRTHGQHALPITVGFWLTTILSRLVANAQEMDRYADALVGKISGAVGAYNAQVALGITTSGRNFEQDVLAGLGLRSAPISTQILPPEPLAYYLFSAAMCSATLGQFGRDGRNLMRSEIGELSEPFEKGQVGSSTMAHKRNPVTFEGVEGFWLKTKKELGGVLDTLISDHQRDLVGSGPARDFPIIIINLVSQMEKLLAQKGGKPFLLRIGFDQAALTRNLTMEGDKILAEPLYLTLQLHGYKGDAHKLVNETAMPLAKAEGLTLVGAINKIAFRRRSLHLVLERIPPALWELYKDPTQYTGHAALKVEQTCMAAEDYLSG